MPTPDDVRAALAPLLKTISSLDLGDPSAARARLDAGHPASSLADLEALLDAANAEGWLTPRRANPHLTYGRLAKAGPETSGLGVEVVDMSGPGPEHVHPNGEVNLCLARGGEPRFCGEPPGWVVVGPGSRHVPEVTGGRMLIVYFLPGGAITWV